MSKIDYGRLGELRPLWLEADAVRERVAGAAGLYCFFSFEGALSQKAAHGHVRTHPAARAALARLVTSPRTRGAVMSGRKAGIVQRRLRLQRVAYVAVYGAEVHTSGLRLVTEPDLETLGGHVAKLRRLCQKSPALTAEGLVLEDRTYALSLSLRGATPAVASAAATEFTRLAATSGLRLRSFPGVLEATDATTGLDRAVRGLLAGLPGALSVYVGAGEADEEAFAAINARNGISVHVGNAPREGTAARFMVADTGEVVRLIHWLADARRRNG